MELGRLLELDDGASLTIARVFTANSTADIEKLFGLLRVPPLPNDERRKLLGEESALPDADASTRELGNEAEAQETPDTLEGGDSLSNGAEACLPEETTRAQLFHCVLRGKHPATSSTPDGNPGAPPAVARRMPPPQRWTLNSRVPELRIVHPDPPTAQLPGLARTPRRLPPSSAPKELTEATLRPAITNHRLVIPRHSPHLPFARQPDRPRANVTPESKRLISYVGNSEAAHEL